MEMPTRKAGLHEGRQTLPLTAPDAEEETFAALLSSRTVRTSGLLLRLHLGLRPLHSPKRQISDAIHNHPAITACWRSLVSQVLSSQEAYR